MDGWRGRLGKEQVWSLSNSQRLADHTWRTADVEAIGDGRECRPPEGQGGMSWSTGKGVDNDREVTVVSFS